MAEEQGGWAPDLGTYRRVEFGTTQRRTAPPPPGPTLDPIKIADRFLQPLYSQLPNSQPQPGAVQQAASYAAQALPTNYGGVQGPILNPDGTIQAGVPAFPGPVTTVPQGGNYVNSSTYVQPPPPPPSGTDGALFTDIVQQVANTVTAPPVDKNTQVALHNFAETLQAQRDELQRQLEQAVSVGADNATKTLQRQLRDVDAQIADVQSQLDNLDGAWDAWVDDSVSKLEEAADDAMTAYTEYKGLVDAGWDEYDAAVESRWNLYKENVRGIIGAYSEWTGETVDELVAKIPSFYAPVIDAIANGKADVVDRIATVRAEGMAAFEQLQLSQDSKMQEILDLIGETNPNTKLEVLTGMNMLIGQAKESVNQGLDHTQRTALFAADIATAAARVERDQRLAEVETQRTQLLAEASLTRDKILRGADQEIEAQLEASNRTRRQMLQDLNDGLRDQLKIWDRTEEEIRQDAEFNKLLMEEELKNALEDLLNTRADLNEDVRTAAANITSQVGENPLDFITDIEYAMGFTETRIHELLGDTNSHERADVINTFNSLINDVGIRSYDHWNKWVQEQGDARHSADLAWQAYAESRQPPLDASDPHLRSAYWKEVLNIDESAFILEDMKHFDVIDEAMRSYWLAIDEYENNPFYGQRPEQFLMPVPDYTTIGGAIGIYGDPRDDDKDGVPDRTHGGLDINAPEGSPIKATAAGTVYSAGWLSDGAGYGVIIDHGGGWFTKYFHMEKDPNTLGIYQGLDVAAGEFIGPVGNTGNSSGPHLHFEVVFEGQTMDPANFLGVTPTR